MCRRIQRRISMGFITLRNLETDDTTLLLHLRACFQKSSHLCTLRWRHKRPHCQTTKQSKCFSVILVTDCAYSNTHYDLDFFRTLKFSFDCPPYLELSLCSISIPELRRLVWPRRCTVLCSGGHRLAPRPRHRLYWGVPWYSVDPSDKCRVSALIRPTPLSAISFLIVSFDQTSFDLRG